MFVIVGFLGICNIKNNDISRIVIRTTTIHVSVGTFEICIIKNGASYGDCDEEARHPCDCGTVEVF